MKIVVMVDTFALDRILTGTGPALVPSAKRRELAKFYEDLKGDYAAFSAKVEAGIWGHYFRTLNAMPILRR